MSNKKKAFLLLGGMSAIFAFLAKSLLFTIDTIDEIIPQPIQEAVKNTVSLSSSTEARIYKMAQNVIAQNSFDANPLMITAMAKIESNFNPRAARYEPHLKVSSFGYMQVLTTTATWLAKDMGYNRYGLPDAADLMDEEKSLYYGAAYVDYLANWKGRRRSEDWIVESYNGGPGNSNSMTRNHLRKYKDAKTKISKTLKTEGVYA